MKFDMMTIQDLRREVLRGNSPSDELLTLWGHQNHTVLELFVLLSEMQHYQAMLVLKPFGESDSLVQFTAWLNIPEYSHLHTHYHKNLN